MKLEKITKYIFSFLIIGLIFSISTITYAGIDYSTDLYYCDTSTGQNPQITGYFNSSIIWQLNCTTPQRLTGKATEGETIVECDKNMGSCGNALLEDEENSNGFISEVIYVKGHLPDDYIQQLEFIGIVAILSFLGTVYLIKKIV